jgi:hypothetical protein
MKDATRRKLALAFVLFIPCMGRSAIMSEQSYYQRLDEDLSVAEKARLYQQYLGQSGYRTGT